VTVAGRLPELFAQAVEAPPAARERLLATLAAEDPALAAELRALLAAAAVRGSLLDQAVPAVAAAAAVPAEGETAHERIGPYRILHELGRGGMGRVFLAREERAAFRRTVALKVIARSGLAGETVRRFRDEVRILAALEHPNIARFLDGGQAPDGTWYLALEYVAGSDLLTHVATQRLDLRQRVTLLRAVLAAVAYAHERGVVHRDLKPGNILVDAEGRPRLLDFGISKLVDPDAGDDAVTRTELRAFTPAYASPEQFRGERATAASDVYSLGVLLYEVLAGTRPFRELASTPSELERAVLEREPEPPSTAARRQATTARRTREGPHGPGGSAPPEAAGEDARGGARSDAPSEPLTHPVRLDRDLDAICLKALRKEPGERYASAAAMAEDLQRWLDGRPVEARRGGRRYRLTRLLRRRRSELAAGLALALAMAALLVAVGTQRPRQTAAAAAPTPQPRPFPFSPVDAPPLAELERRFAAQPDSIAAGSALVLALSREAREPEATLVVSRLRQIPGGETDPLVDYADGMLAAHRDQPQRALVLYTQGLQRAVAGARGELTGQLRAARGRTYAVLGRRAEARADMEAARREFAAAGDDASLARVLNDLAIEELEDGRLSTGERLLEEALAATRRHSPDNRGGSFLHNLAVVAFMRGRPDLAEPRLREVEAIFRQLGRPRPLGSRLLSRAQNSWDLGRAAEAEPLFAEALALLREHREDATLASGLVAWADVEIERGRREQAAAIGEEVARSAEAAGNTTSLSLAELVRGRVAVARGDLPAARHHLADCRRLATVAGNADIAAEAAVLLAEAELLAGDAAAARVAAEEAAVPFRDGGEHRALFAAEAVLAVLDARAGDLAAARRRLTVLGRLAPGAREGCAAASSLPLRLGCLRARAELARAEGRPEEAARIVAAAVAAAEAGERHTTAAALRAG
jgi:serine/threonine-protein kinase